MQVFIILVVAVFSVASASRHGKLDYYWREYDGKVPKDALKVAQNGSDVPIYIGQGHFDWFGLLPGMITDGIMELSVAIKNDIHTIRENIKILATNNVRPEKNFYWLPINYDNFHNLEKLDFLYLINGGTESYRPLYIGRHSEPGYTTIGRISSVEPLEGLIIADRLGNVALYKNFEALITLEVDCDESKNENNSKKSKDNSASFEGFV